MNIAEKVIRAKSDYDEVYEAGKQAEWNKFWDTFQVNGTRTNYTSAFACNTGTVWTDENYNPKYPITIDGASSAGNLSFQMFKGTDTKVPIIYADGLVGGISTVFQNALLVKIQELHLVEGLSYTIAFNGMKYLEELNVTGVIGGNGFNVSWSPLNHDSLMTIIKALKNYSADTSGTEWVVTIGPNNKAKLSADELAIAQNRGWQVN